MLTHMTPINAHTHTHTATGLTPQMLSAPVWRQRKQRLTQNAQRDSSIRFMWLKCHWYVRKGSHSDAETKMCVATKTEYISR